MTRNSVHSTGCHGGDTPWCCLRVLSWLGPIAVFALAIAAGTSPAAATSGEIPTGPLLAGDGNDFDFGILGDVNYTEFGGEAFISGAARDESVVPPVEEGMATIIAADSVTITPVGDSPEALDENVTVNATQMIQWTCGQTVDADTATCLVSASRAGVFQVRQGNVVVKKRGSYDHEEIFECDSAACTADFDKFSAFEAYLSPDGPMNTGTVAFYNSLLPSNIDRLEWLLALTDSTTGTAGSVQILTAVPDTGIGAGARIAEGPALLTGVKLAPPAYLFTVYSPLLRSGYNSNYSF